MGLQVFLANMLCFHLLANKELLPVSRSIPKAKKKPLCELCVDDVDPQTNHLC